MKPIGRNPGLDAAPASQPDGQDACQLRSPELKPKTKSSATARIEDIIAAAPVSSRARKPASNGVSVSADFLAKLQAAVTQGSSFEQVQAFVTTTLVQNAACSFVGWFQPAGEKIGESARLVQLNQANTETPAAVLQVLQIVAATASSESRLVAQPTPDASAASIAAASAVASAAAIATPIAGTQGQCLVVACRTNSNDQNYFAQTAAIELAASKIGEWLNRQLVDQAGGDSRHVAALVELTSLVLSSESRKAAGQCLVDQLKQYLRADEVYFGACRHQSLTCHLTAVSGTPDIDRHSDTTKIAEAVMQESIARSVASIWPAAEASNRHALLSHQHFAESRSAAAVVACPLRNEAGDVVGCLVASFKAVQASSNTDGIPTETPRKAAEDALRFLHAGTRSIGTAVHVVHRSTRGNISHWTAKLRKLITKQKAATAAILTAAITGVLLIPVDYRVRCECELQPVSRRFIAAPFDAPLEECFVQPGDVVEQDQILARLDGRELYWEQAGIKADLGKATKEHNTFLSEQEFGDAAIARHEIDRLQNKSALLSKRNNELDIRSPMAGVIVAGDLKDT